MTDTPTRDSAQDAIAITAETLGHDFVAALLAELRQMPDHWARLNEKTQQQIIERVKEKVRAAVTKAQGMMIQAGFAAVPADLESVTFKNGLTASLKIPKDALHRHEFADAQGSRVLVVIADGERWLHRMDEIKSKGDQMALFDGDYDPSIDQPNYRRDQDRTLPAGPTWEDLKKTLTKSKAEPAPAAAAPAPTEGEAPAAADSPPAEGEIVFGSSATEQEERTIQLRILQEQLGALGVALSLGAVQAFTPEQLAATRTWADAYAAAPDACKIARPLWLPIPTKGEDDAPDSTE